MITLQVRKQKNTTHAQTTALHTACSRCRRHCRLQQRSRRESRCSGILLGHCYRIQTLRRFQDFTQFGFGIFLHRLGQCIDIQCRLTALWHSAQQTSPDDYDRRRVRGRVARSACRHHRHGHRLHQTYRRYRGFQQWSGTPASCFRGR